MDKISLETCDKNSNIVNINQISSKRTRIASSSSEEQNNSFEKIDIEIEIMRQKNADQFCNNNGNKNQQAESDKLVENYKLIKLEQEELSEELETERDKCRELLQQNLKLMKELDEFKKINTIQENCIENSESEILRLSECLKLAEQRLQETVEISEEIISNLKSKLESANTVQAKITTVAEPAIKYKRERSQTRASHHHQVKGQSTSTKPAFYVDLNKNSNSLLNQICDKNPKTFDIKVLETELSNDLKQSVVTIIRQLCQSVDSIDTIPELLTQKLNESFGKHWNCLITQNLFNNCVINYLNGFYLKCELNKSINLLVFKTINSSSNVSQISENSEIITINGTNQTVRITKKSNNIEGQVERFIINTTIDAINRNFDNYHTMSSFIRDAICGKYSSQWFVSVGESKHYCTSWAMSRSRKFMLFEISNIKFTLGEVAGGWLW